MCMLSMNGARQGAHERNCLNSGAGLCMIWTFNWTFMETWEDEKLMQAPSDLLVSPVCSSALQTHMFSTWNVCIYGSPIKGSLEMHKLPMLCVLKHHYTAMDADFWTVMCALHSPFTPLSLFSFSLLITSDLIYRAAGLFALCYIA